MRGPYHQIIVGLWLTPAGLATTDGFLPVAAKTSARSASTLLLGFSSLAFFYPKAGVHRDLRCCISLWITRC